MTIIAWDGKTLAADKAATSVGYRRTVTKLYAVPDGMVAFAGDGDRAMALLDWFRKGRAQDEYPKFQNDSDTVVDAMFIDWNGVCWAYGKWPYPQRGEDKFNASGHGRDFALAAMHLGYSARIACEVACKLDTYCGNGIDTMTLEDARRVYPADQAGHVQLPEEAAVQR